MSILGLHPDHLFQQSVAARIRAEERRKPEAPEELPFVLGEVTTSTVEDILKEMRIGRERFLAAMQTKSEVR